MPAPSVEVENDILSIASTNINWMNIEFVAHGGMPFSSTPSFNWTTTWNENYHKDIELLNIPGNGVDVRISITLTTSNQLITTLSVDQYLGGGLDGHVSVSLTVVYQTPEDLVWDTFRLDADFDQSSQKVIDLNEGLTLINDWTIMCENYISLITYVSGSPVTINVDKDQNGRDDVQIAIEA